MTAEEFRSVIRHVYRTVFQAPQAGDGLPEESLLEAEAALGFRLPAVLRQFYLELGRNTKAMDALNHVLPPDRIVKVQDSFVFCEENQRAFFWAIREQDVHEEDPPVLQGSVDSDDQHFVSSHLSTFLVNLLCWQAMNALPAGGEASATDDLLKRLTAQLERPVKNDEIADREIISFIDDGLAVCYFPRDNRLDAAAQSDERLEAFEQDFHVSLSWF